MWPPVSPPIHSDFDTRKQRNRPLVVALVAAAALLVGAGLGGASMFAIVAALTAPPRHDAAAAGRSADQSASPGPVVAAPQPQASSTPAAVKSPQQDEAPPPQQPGKPWPDALSRIHSAETAKPAQPAATSGPLRTNERAGDAKRPETKSTDRAPASRTDAVRSDRYAGERNADASREAPPAADAKAAERGGDDGQESRAPARTGRDAKGAPRTRFAYGRPHDGDNGAQPGWGSSSANSRPATAESTNEDTADDEHGRWRDRDHGGLFGLFGLFGQHDNWRDDWRADRDSWHDD
jgi:hypothetical protein